MPLWECPANPVVGTWHFHCQGTRFNPWSRKQDPASLSVRPKNLKEKVLHLFTKGFPLPILATSHLCRGSEYCCMHPHSHSYTMAASQIYYDPIFLWVPGHPQNPITALRLANTNQAGPHSQVEVYSLWLWQWFLTLALCVLVYKSFSYEWSYLVM